MLKCVVDKKCFSCGFFFPCLVAESGGRGEVGGGQSHRARDSRQTVEERKGRRKSPISTSPSSSAPESFQASPPLFSLRKPPTASTSKTPLFRSSLPHFEFAFPAFLNLLFRLLFLCQSLFPRRIRIDRRILLALSPREVKRVERGGNPTLLSDFSPSLSFLSLPPYFWLEIGAKWIALSPPPAPNKNYGESDLSKSNPPFILPILLRRLNCIPLAFRSPTFRRARAPCPCLPLHLASTPLLLRLPPLPHARG